MLYWVIYDISSNAKRLAVSERCKDFGLLRVQKSAFLGTLSKNRAEMLAIKIKGIIGEGDDAAFIIPSCESCFAGKIVLGKLDEESVRAREFRLVG